MTPTLLLTRPEPGASGFAQDCSARFPDLPIVCSPIMKIEPKGESIHLSEAVILSSAHAVAQIALGGRRVAAYCVGARTAAAARDAGLNIALVARDADHLVTRILRDPPAGALLHLRGEHSRGDICSRLNAGGLTCRETVVYRQREQGLSNTAQQLLANPAPVIVPLFSPRSAKLLSLQLPTTPGPIWLAAFSPAVRGAWKGPVTMAETATAPNSASLLDAIARLIESAHSLEGDTRPI